jgi:lysophospholipase L1-like esterase
MSRLAALMVLAAATQLPAQTPATPVPTVAQLQAKLDAQQAQLNDWPNLARYRKADLELPAMEDGRVVFFGDSITDAWTANGGKFFRTGDPDGRSLSGGVAGKPYVNRGISGQTTPQMLVRFRQDVVDLHPDAVVILAGTNDIAGNTGPSSLVMIEDNLRSITEIAKANGIHVILASVLPVAKYPWRPEVPHPATTIGDLNRWMRSYCGQAKITYLDYWTAMATPEGGMKPGISKDGVHPNAAGYAIMEPLAEQAITASQSQATP